MERKRKSKIKSNITRKWEEIRTEGIEIQMGRKTETNRAK
jgi:hypothetical protein